MARRQISLEWQVLEDEEAWHGMVVDEGKPAVLRNPLFSAGEQRLLMQLLRLCAIILGAVTITGTSFSPTQPASAHEDSLQATLQLEAQAWQTHDSNLFNTLLDPQISTRWQLEWQKPWNDTIAKEAELGETVLSTEPINDLVLVKLKVTRPDAEWWRSLPYRETRFYRQGEQGWVRTVPAQEFWGKLRTLETPHLRFEFYDYDVQTVMTLVDQTERLYVRLYDVLALDPPPARQKLTFAIVPHLAREWGYYGERQEFTSPTFAKIPERLSDTEYLAHQFVSRLVYQATRNLVVSNDTERDYVYQWRTMLWALNGWLRTELLEQRSPWHEQADDIFRQYTSQHLPLRLTDVSELNFNERLDREAWMLNYGMAESVITYVIDTYGSEQLPTLLRGLHQSASWDELTLRLFAMPVEDFEAGWNRYLAERNNATTSSESSRPLR